MKRAESKAETRKLVSAYIATLRPPIRGVVSALRRLVHEVAPEAKETLKWGIPTYSLERIVCYILPTKGHVTLGFYRGADLSDPHGLLVGEGKKLRHVKISKVKDTRNRALKRLVREAFKLNAR